MYPNKIVFRLLLAFLLISPLPLAGLAWFYMQAFEETLKQDQLKNLSSIANKKTDQINTYINERLSDCKSLASSPNTTDALNTLSALFASEKITSSRYRNAEQSFLRYFNTPLLESVSSHDVLLINAAGNVVLSIKHESDYGDNLNAGTERDTPLAMAHRAALITMETQITPAFLYAPSAYMPAIFIVAPVMSSGKVIGTVALQLDLAKLTAVTSDTTGLGETGETVLAQLQGKEALYVGPLRHIPDVAFRRRISLDQIAPPMQAAFRGDDGEGISRDYAGVEVLAAWRYLPGLHWGMDVKIDAVEAFAPLYHLQKVAAIALGVILLIACLAAILLSRMLVTPIRKLVEATEHLAEGELSELLQDQGLVELQQLADSFNTMAKKLHASHSELERQVAQRTSELTVALKDEASTKRVLQLERDSASGIISIAPVIILLLDREGNIQHINPYFERMSGYSLDEVVGKEWFATFLSARDQDMVRTLFNNAKFEDIHQSYINPIVIRSGEERQIEWHNRAIRDVDGTIASVLSIGSDVTDRKAAQDRLSISEQRLNEAQRIAQVGSWELDLVTGRLDWSDEIFNLFEIDKSKFGATYEAFLNGIHPDDRGRVNQAYTNSLVTRAPYDVTHRLKMSDGRIKWVEERCYSEFDADGKPLRSVGTVQDITKLKQAEFDLGKSESLFRTLAQVAPVGIFRTDLAGNCIYVNENFCEIAGVDMNAALGNGWTAAIHPDDRARVFEKWTESVKKSTPFFLEYRFRRPTGHVTWVVGQAREELGADGEVLGYVGTITDINQRKHAEDALKRLNEVLEQRVQDRTAQLLTAKEDAEQANRTKSLFLSSMSHELRTPLNAILGYAQLMQIDQSLPEPVVENAHEIRRAGDYLLSLVNDLLDLARIESGRMEMQITALDLPEVIQECCAQNSKSAQARNIVMIKDASCAAFKVSADRRRLLQVFNNLISNAIKYNRVGGKVTVMCSAVANGRIRIAVSDTGMGIPPEKQAQLFEPFNRLGAEMGKIEGTGIGLVIARKLIENMNGVIGVDSTLGTGSTFWLELPAAAGVSAVAIPRRSSGKFRVLVAEDYAANQVLLKLQLQTLGCEVEIAANGAVALEKWRAARHDLILTDLNMPVMDGLGLARAVREDELNSGCHTPIIAITAAAVRAELQRSRDAGMDDVLTKPIALDGLRAVLSRWMDNIPLPEVTMPDIPAGGADAVLDIAQLYRILGRVSVEQARELIATFLSSAREGLDALAQISDANAVSREMHKLKSSARTVGAMHFAKLAEILEKQSEEKKSADMVSSLVGLRRALSEVEAAMPRLHLDTPHLISGSYPAYDISKVNCNSVLVVDDDLVILQQMSAMLSTLGVAEVLTANNGIEAIKQMSLRSSELEVLVCDLNMPEMDGVELIRKIGQTGFSGGLILMSGADEKVLSTVNRLAGLQGLRVLGQLQKPVMPHQIAGMLSQAVVVPKPKRQTYVAPIVTSDDILAGMAANEFSVWFQPKVDALNLLPAGLEALARWKRADGKFIPPDIFITVAEHEGLIGELSKVLVVTALAEAAKLFASGHALKTAINLSGRWLNDLSLPEYILANTLLVGLRAEDIILEVTETGVMEDMTTALDVLTRMRLKGFGLSIDDFGIGYSSFEQLGRIPFTELKLDRSFVNRGTHDVAARAILESSMDMARKLGLSTVAEGVETEAELELIRSLGCDRVQGYYVAKPMPLDELLVWLRSR